MNEYTTHKRSFAKHALAIGLLGLGATLTHEALAACGSYQPPGGGAAPRREAPGFERDGLMSVAYLTGAQPLQQLIADRDEGRPAIVGTWRFTFISDGNAYPKAIGYGETVDFGTSQWHRDGTELMISGGRAPSTGDVCMGSWQQTGPNTYRLKHIALAYVSPDSLPPAPGAAYLGPVIIRENVTVNRARNTFEGTFTLDQYARDEVTLLEHISGNVTATRFGVD